MVAVNSCSTYKSCPHRKRKLQKVKVVIDEGCLSILCFGLLLGRSLDLILLFISSCTSDFLSELIVLFLLRKIVWD